MTERRRVVISGYGAVTPLGANAETFWQGLVAGRSGVRSISTFDASRVTSRIAGEVPDFDPSVVLDRKEIRRNDRTTQMALVVTRAAMEMANLPGRLDETDALHTAVVIGSGLGGTGTLIDQIGVNATRGPDRLSPFFIPMAIGNMAAGQVAISFNAKGPNFSTASTKPSRPESNGRLAPAGSSLRVESARIAAKPPTVAS